jgi:YVTN family beta-propeller protein
MHVRPLTKDSKLLLAIVTSAFLIAIFVNSGLLLSSAAYFAAPGVPASHPVNLSSKKIIVGYNSEQVISDSTGKYLYVVNFNSISVINASINKVVKTVKLEPGTCCNYDYQAQWADYDSASNSLYVFEHRVGINAGYNIVSVINSSWDVVAKIKIGYGGATTYAIGYNPVTNMVYVPNETNNTVSIINATTNRVQMTVSVGAEPLSVAFSASGNTYISNFGDDSVSVISTSGKVNTIQLNDGFIAGPSVMAYDPVNKELYVADRYSAYPGLVSVIDTTKNELVTAISMNGCDNPLGISYNPYYKIVYVASLLDSTVAAINATTNSVLTVTGVGYYPWMITYSPANHRTYVMDSGNGLQHDNMVSEFSGAYLAKNVEVGLYPLVGAFSSVDDDVYVVCQGNTTHSSVYVIS